ncbi:MAG: hypothetical protein CM15mP13_3390 [Pseudomonadota bacterium]|nr:MAG: hypothetical protein CM15mP13_3390 [Pseudomonadota bacterium]
MKAILEAEQLCFRSIISIILEVLDLGEINAFERSFKEWKEKKGKVDLVDLYMQRINKELKSHITTNKWLYNYQYAGIIASQIPNSKLFIYRILLDDIQIHLSNKLCEER